MGWDHGDAGPILFIGSMGHLNTTPHQQRPGGGREPSLEHDKTLCYCVRQKLHRIAPQRGAEMANARDRYERT